MKTNKYVEDLKAKTAAELNEELVAAKKELFNLRFQNATNQLDRWYPSLLLFPVLFYYLTEAIFRLPGVDFSVTSWSLAGIVVIAIPLLSRLMKYLVPEDDLRLEVHFLVSLFICILGLLTTVNGKTTYAATEEALNWKAIILSIGLFVVLFLIGFAWNKLKWPLLQRKELKKRSKINQ